MHTNNDPHFRNLVDNALIGIIDNTLEGRILFVNQALARMLEFESPQQMQAEGTLLRWCDPEDRKAFISSLNQQGYVNNYEADLFSRTGRHMHVLLSARLQGDVISSMVVDITDRKRAETALQNSERRFSDIADNALEWIWEVDGNGKYTYASPVVEKLMGYKPEEILKKHFYDLIHPDDKEELKQAAFEVFARKEKFNGFINRNVHKNGTVVWLSTSGIPVIDESGELVGYRGADIDITKRKQAEEKLQEYQRRLRALASELTLTEEKQRRNIALELHDQVGQSLAVMRMQLAVARKESSGRKVAAILDEVSGSLRAAIQDTRHIISDLSSPLINELGLAAALSEWLKERIGEYYGLESQFTDDGEPKPLGKDTEAILFRSVRELLTNVVKHANANRVSVSFQRIGSTAQVVVEDDGAGLADGMRTEKDTTADGGFGLFSIRERMSDLGGTLEIESLPGQGVRAILTAPLASDQ